MSTELIMLPRFDETSFNLVETSVIRFPRFDEEVFANLIETSSTLLSTEIILLATFVERSIKFYVKFVDVSVNLSSRSVIFVNTSPNASTVTSSVSLIAL